MPQLSNQLYQYPFSLTFVTLFAASLLSKWSLAQSFHLAFQNGYAHAEKIPLKHSIGRQLSKAAVNGTKHQTGTIRSRFLLTRSVARKITFSTAPNTASLCTVLNLGNRRRSDDCITSRSVRSVRNHMNGTQSKASLAKPRATMH